MITKFTEKSLILYEKKKMKTVLVQNIPCRIKLLSSLYT